METQYVNITKEDLAHYFKTLSNKGVIRQMRIRIFNSMPNDIKTEFKTKINELTKVNNESGHYKIVAENASPKLQKYLDKVVFTLNSDSDPRNQDQERFSVVSLNMKF